MVEPREQEAFRNKVKSNELEAEQLQQQALYDLTSRRRSARKPIRARRRRAISAAYEHIVGATFPRETVDVLLRPR